MSGLRPPQGSDPWGQGASHWPKLRETRGPLHPVLRTTKIPLFFQKNTTFPGFLWSPDPESLREWAEGRDPHLGPWVPNVTTPSSSTGKFWSYLSGTPTTSPPEVSSLIPQGWALPQLCLSSFSWSGTSPGPGPPPSSGLWPSCLCINSILCPPRNCWVCALSGGCAF